MIKTFFNTAKNLKLHISGAKRFYSNIKKIESGEWIYNHRDYTSIGLTKNSLLELNDLIYIDFTVNKGDVVKENEEMVTIESVKTVETIKAPYDCVILQINESLSEPGEALDYLNEVPENFEDSWIIRIDKIP